MPISSHVTLKAIENEVGKLTESNLPNIHYVQR